MMNKKIINKYYDKFKDFIKNNLKGIIFLVLFACFCFYDTGYVIYKPGGTINASKRISGDNLSVSKGSYNMAYVSMMEGNLPIYLFAKLKSEWEIVKKEDLTYNDSEEVSDALKRDHLSYEEAISNALYVAFNKSNADFNIDETHYYINYKTEKNKSNLKIGDEIISYDGTKFNGTKDFIEYINSKNTSDLIKIEYKRDNKTYQDDVVVYEENERKYVGLSISMIYDITSSYNIEVKTKSSESGPSGGLITALTIYDALVEEDITKGNKIVGTGTIDADGNVGEIGSVEYKLMGAVKDNADVFLCPMENLDAAKKFAKEKNYDIIIYGVADFDDALQALSKLKEKK